MLIIIEWLRLEGTLKIIQFQTFVTCRVAIHRIRVPRASSNLVSNTSRDGASMAFQATCSSASLPLSKKFFPNLQADQAQIPQLVFIGKVLQPFSYLCGLPLDLLQQLHIFPVLGAPGLDTVLQMEPTRAEQRGTIPSLPLLPPLC